MTILIIRSSMVIALTATGTKISRRPNKAAAAIFLIATYGVTQTTA